MTGFNSTNEGSRFGGKADLSVSIFNRPFRSLLREVFRNASSAKNKNLRVVFADGSEFTNFASGSADVTINFLSGRSERRAILFFYHGLLEGWFDEEVEITGDKPIQTLASLVHHSAANVAKGFTLSPLSYAEQRIFEWRHNNRNVLQAKKNADFHYAIDHRFFQIMLGETLGYSEGYWVEGTATLNQAKYNAYNLICHKLRLEPGMHVLEVGAGWGYLALLMAKKFGVTVTIYNPVQAQNEYMIARFARHNVSDRIRVLAKDHRDIANEPGRYDRFVTVGVQEHAGKDCYDLWMASVAKALKPAGLGVISTTTLMGRYLTEFLITKHIFPGGHIPSLALLLKTMDKYGLMHLHTENLWPHYKRTLEAWRDNVAGRWPEIRQLDPVFFNERFRRRWAVYLEGTIENFDYALDLSHIEFVKGRIASEVRAMPPLSSAEFATGSQPVETWA